MAKRLIYILFSLFLFVHVSAQIDNTMYFMDRLPQSTYINPAQTPECKFYMGGVLIPIFGQLPPPITFAVNLPVDYNDVIFHGSGEYADSLITPLHPNASFDDFLDKLRKVNYVTTDLQLSLLNFGFKTGKNSFFTFDMSERMFVDAGLPRSLFEFAAKGNDAVRMADFTGFGLNAMYYHQLAFGLQHKFSKTLSMGLRAKLLVGVANVRNAETKLVLTTAEKTNYINVEAEYIVNTNIPLDVTLDDEGFVSEMSFNNVFEDKSNIAKYALLTGNYGAALDFGLSKEINSYVTAFFSVEDFGLINWKTNASKFALYDEDSMRFEGVKISDLRLDGFGDVINPDSIVANFKEIRYEEQSYVTKLPTKLYAGVRYHASKRMSLGALGKIEFLPYKVRPSLMLTANFRPFKFTAVTLSYSCMNGNFNNLGLGFTLHPGITQWYFVSDNILGAALFPANSREVNVRIGCNLMFGCVQKKGTRDKRTNNASLLDRKKHQNKGVVPQK